jgi:hypothetical protein
MTSGEIAEAILRGVRAYESHRMKLFDLATYIERLSVELEPIDAGKGIELRELALQFAASDVDKGGGTTDVVLDSIRLFAALLATSYPLLPRHLLRAAWAASTA